MVVVMMVLFLASYSSCMTNGSCAFHWSSSIIIARFAIIVFAIAIVISTLMLMKNRICMLVCFNDDDGDGNDGSHVFFIISIVIESRY